MVLLCRCDLIQSDLLLLSAKSERRMQQHHLSIVSVRENWMQKMSFYSLAPSNMGIILIAIYQQILSRRGRTWHALGPRFESHSRQKLYPLFICKNNYNEINLLKSNQINIYQYKLSTQLCFIIFFLFF